MLVAWKAVKGISDHLKHVLVVFFSQRGPQRPFQGPYWSQMDDLVFHEKWRYNILLWDDLTVEKKFSDSKAPPTAPRVPNGLKWTT